MRNYTDGMWSFCDFQYAGEGVQQNTKVYKAINCKGAVCYFDAQLRGIRFETFGFLIYRSVFDEVRMFNPEIQTAEDIELWARIAMRYPKMIYSPDICYRY